MPGRGFDEDGGSHDGCEVIIPPRPLRKYLYLCDRSFHLEVLEPLFTKEDRAGLVLVKGEETECYFISVQTFAISLEKRIKGRIPGRTCRGGQSQNRIQRLRNEAEGVYITKVVEDMKQIYEGKVDDIIIMGNAQKKDLVYQKLDQSMRNLVKKVIKISGCERLDQLTLLALQTIKERREISPWESRFLDDIAIGGGLASYGNDQIMEELKEAGLKVLIVKAGSLTNRIKEMAGDVGCVLIETSNHHIYQYGDMVGIRWYPLLE